MLLLGQFGQRRVVADWYKYNNMRTVGRVVMCIRTNRGTGMKNLKDQPIEVCGDHSYSMIYAGHMLVPLSRYMKPITESEAQMHSPSLQ